MKIRITKNPEPIARFGRKLIRPRDVKETAALENRRIVILRDKPVGPVQAKASFAVESKASGGFEVIKDEEGNTVDYRNVRFRGYLSTFENVTPEDRDGDRVLRGAFRETLPRFMKNPVVLCNHRNDTGQLCGRVTRAFEDDKGLFVEGEISNGQSDFLKHVRALVAEGILRTLSMGGMFFYRADGKTIEQVELFECTLTPIPANPDAIIQAI